MRTFHLGDILSITTGKLVSPRHVDGVYEILNYMTGDNLFTHQLLRACRECAPALMEQHPELAGVDASGVTPENWRTWMDAQIKRYGAALPVEPLAHNRHGRIDALQEAADMVGAHKVIVVGASERKP